MKTVKVSCWVAKPAWDQTVGGTHLCPIATDWVTARSQFSGIWFWPKSSYGGPSGQIITLHVIRSTIHHCGRRV